MAETDPMGKAVAQAERRTATQVSKDDLNQLFSTLEVDFVRLTECVISPGFAQAVGSAADADIDRHAPPPAGRNLVDAMLSANRDMAAAMAFFRPAKAVTGVTPSRSRPMGMIATPARSKPSWEQLSATGPVDS